MAIGSFKQSPSEFVVFLDGLDSGDPEASHSMADKAVGEFLRDLGYGDVADAWHRAADRVPFWCG